MNFKDVKPGLYVINGDTENFEEARDANYRPVTMLKYEHSPGLPKLEFFSMGWDCDNNVDINAEYEPAMVITCAAWDAAQDEIRALRNKVDQLDSMIDDLEGRRGDGIIT